MTPSDDECIAITFLHGGEFWKGPQTGWWYVKHVVDGKRQTFIKGLDGKLPTTRGMIARAYCIHFNLI
jgi:hypothetical protein